MMTAREGPHAFIFTRVLKDEFEVSNLSDGYLDYRVGFSGKHQHLSIKNFSHTLVYSVQITIDREKATSKSSPHSSLLPPSLLFLRNSVTIFAAPPISNTSHTMVQNRVNSSRSFFTNTSNNVLDCIAVYICQRLVSISLLRIFNDPRTVFVISRLIIVPACSQFEFKAPNCKRNVRNVLSRVHSFFYRRSRR